MESLGWLQASAWGIVAASSLVVGAEVAFRARLARRTIGLVLAFGVGTLLASISFELIEPALATDEAIRIAVGLALGSLAFYGGDRAISKLGAGARSRPTGDPSSTEEGGGRSGDDETEESGLPVVLGTVLDGVPESAVLGMSLVGGGSVSVALLAGIWLSNLPEALASSVDLRRSGMAPSRIRAMWLGIVAISAAAAAIGFAIVEASPDRTGSLIEAFAAGALLTMVIDAMAPTAEEEVGLEAGLAAVAGFALAIWLSGFG